MNSARILYTNKWDFLLKLSRSLLMSITNIYFENRQQKKKLSIDEIYCEFCSRLVFDIFIYITIRCFLLYLLTCRYHQSYLPFFRQYTTFYSYKESRLKFFGSSRYISERFTLVLGIYTTLHIHYIHKFVKLVFNI